jgi:hypothetical protein
MIEKEIEDVRVKEILLIVRVLISSIEGCER